MPIYWFLRGSWVRLGQVCYRFYHWVSYPYSVEWEEGECDENGNERLVVHKRRYFRTAKEYNAFMEGSYPNT